MGSDPTRSTPPFQFQSIQERQNTNVSFQYLTILLARTSLIPFGLSKGLSRHEKKASVNGLMYVDVVVYTNLYT